MDIDRLLAEADPARSIAIPGPDSPEARQALGQLTKSAPRPASHPPAPAPWRRSRYRCPQFPRCPHLRQRRRRGCPGRRWWARPC